MIKIGDAVARKSYNLDIIFEVVDIDDHLMATLIGKTVRLIADAPLDDLVKMSEDEVRKVLEEEEKIIESIQTTHHEANRYKFIPGKILHFDGDEKYMKKCLDLYKNMGIYAVGVNIKESELAKEITKYIKYFAPDIVVITGHDSYNKQEMKEIENYRNSRFFFEATKEVRKHYPVINQPIVIAGACQSHFEALISAGANFASSPSRVNIKSLDPAIIAVKCATTPINRIIKVQEVIEKTSNKNLGLGGIESYGTMKTLFY